jgi:hypothetical protein
LQQDLLIKLDVGHSKLILEQTGEDGCRLGNVARYRLRMALAAAEESRRTGQDDRQGWIAALTIRAVR